MSQPTSELKSVTVPADGDVPLALSDPSSVQLPEQGTGTSSATTNPLTAALPTLAHLSEYVPLPRATDHEANSKSPNSLNVDGLVRRKNTSFKITNILSSAPPGNDQDESGEDDPDDSRTEDISDNVEDLIFMRGPVGVRRGSIPVELTTTLIPMSEFASFVGGSSGASTPGQGPVHGPRDRFKVVKIETSAPHKRGRWTCVQYADKNVSAPAVQQSTVSCNTTTITTATIVTSNSACTDSSAGIYAVNSEETYPQNSDQSDPTPRIMSPTVQNKEVVESEHVIHSANHQSSSSAQTPQIGASYSTSPIPFSSHSVPLQTSVSNVASLQPSTSQVSTSQMPIYSPVSMALGSTSQNIQSVITMTQAQPSSIQQVSQPGMHHQTMQIPQQGLVQQQQQLTGQPQAGVLSQSIPNVSQSMVIPQQVSISQNMPTVVIPTPMQQQAPNNSSQQGIQMQPQSSTVDYQQPGGIPQSVLITQQVIAPQGSTLNQPIVIQQQQQSQSMTIAQQAGASQAATLSQPIVMSQGVAMPQALPVSQASLSSQTMSVAQSVPVSQPSPLIQPVPICQIPSSQVSSSSVVSMAATGDLVVSTSSHYPVSSSSSTIQKFDPMTSTTIHGGSGLQSPSSSSHAPNASGVSNLFGGVYSQQQQSPVQQQSQYQQIPHSQYQPMHQPSSTYPSTQSLISAQSNAQQQPMQQVPQQNQVVQPSTLLSASQTSQTTQQSNLESQNIPIQPISNTGSASHGKTSQAGQGLAAADRNTAYMTPMSRPMAVAQQVTVSQAYLSVSSPVVLPSSSTSTVNSMPPSRDPVSGVSGNIPVVNPAARDPSYVASQATFPDSLPVASDLLVERLEEISTQQELVEDPESTEIRQFSIKCLTCGLPERVNCTHPEVPHCGHSHMTPPRRMSSVQAPSGFYNSMACSPVSSPLTFSTSSVALGGVSGFCPIRDSPKSLMDLVCSASGSNQGAIDNRIEQAMDLVKSHLMNAVRSEVDELKERIVKLEEIIAQLQSENEFFRANVHRDVLLQLQQQQQALGSPASQQALQMIQQPSNQQQPPQV